MVAIPDDPKGVVEAALRFEEEAYRILCDAKDKAEDPLSKATFDFLAGEEVKHMEAIKAFAGSLALSGAFDPAILSRPITVNEAKQEIKGIFARFQPEFAETAAKGRPRLKVYAIAMDMERWGHDFYLAAAEQATDDTARKLYRFLSDEEIKHFEIIQDTHDFLKQPDAFMAIEEHWMTF